MLTLIGLINFTNTDINQWSIFKRVLHKLYSIDHFSLFVEMAIPLPLGSALSKPLQPSTHHSDLALPHLSSMPVTTTATGNTFLPNSSANNFRSLMGGSNSSSSSHDRSSHGNTNTTNTSINNIHSIMGLTSNHPASTTVNNHHSNISTTNSGNHLIVGGGNPNSLAVGGRSTGNHMAG